MHYDEPLRAVELTREARAVCDAYCEAWKARYGGEPMVMAEDAVIFRHIADRAGVKRAVELVRHFVKMNTAYFLEHAHAARLLRTVMNQVIASMGSRHAGQSEPRMWVMVACNYCPPGRQNELRLIGDSAFIASTKRQCAECKREGREVMCTPQGEPIVAFMARLEKKRAELNAAREAGTDPLGPEAVATILEQMGVKMPEVVHVSKRQVRENPAPNAVEVAMGAGSMRHYYDQLRRKGEVVGGDEEAPF